MTLFVLAYVVVALGVANGVHSSMDEGGGGPVAAALLIGIIWPVALLWRLGQTLGEWR
jgi:hypothetical protein